MRLLHQAQPACYVAGVPAEQNTEIVFRLRNELFQGDDLGFRLLQQSLRLIDVGDGAFAAFELDFIQL